MVSQWLSTDGLLAAKGAIVTTWENEASWPGDQKYIAGEQQLGVTSFLTWYLEKSATSLSVALQSGMENLKPILRNLRQTQIVEHSVKKKLAWIVPKCQCCERYKRLRNCSRGKEIKETWQLNVPHDPGLDPVQGHKMLQRTILSQLTKLEYWNYSNVKFSEF